MIRVFGLWRAGAQECRMGMHFGRHSRMYLYSLTNWSNVQVMLPDKPGELVRHRKRLRWRGTCYVGSDGYAEAHEP